MATEQPKKPVGGAYGQFLAEKRPEFTKKCEGKPVSDISKMAGAGWKALSDADKVPYQKKYEVVKAKFEVDMAAFLSAGGVKTKGAAGLRNEKRKAKAGGLDKKGKKIKVKDPNHPKRPAGGAFGCFLSANRTAFQKECPGAVTGVTKLASAKWKVASEADKAKFEKEYQAKKAAYDEVMKTYVPPAGAAEDDEEEEIEDASPEKADKKAAPVDKKAAKEAKKAEAVAAKDQKKADAASKKEAAKSGKAKVAKGKAKAGAKKPAEPEISIPQAVLAKAEKADMAGALRKLLARPDVQEKDVSPKDALAALEASGGLLHKARAALLGA